MRLWKRTLSTVTCGGGNEELRAFQCGSKRKKTIEAYIAMVVEEVTGKAVKPADLAAGIALMRQPDLRRQKLFSTIARFTGTNSAPRGHAFTPMHRGYLVVIFSNDGGGGNGSDGFTF